MNIITVKPNFVKKIKLKRIYLFLGIVGTILPNIFVIKESIASGNILLYRYPLDTFRAMFVNNVSSAFMMDLLFVVLLFLAWTLYEYRTLRWKGVFGIWIYTFAFGIAGGLPLYLFFRHDKIK